MAAPQTNPDLSVVSPDATHDGKAEENPEASAPTALPSTGQKQEQGRRVPLWLLLVAIALGAAAWFSQYQRAVQLDARVVSLTDELKTAGEQLGAYQSHLDSVRVGVGDLSAQMASLKTLVDQDPLAPAPAAADSKRADSVVPAAAAPAERAQSSQTQPVAPSQPVGRSETLPVVNSSRVDIAEALSDANLNGGASPVIQIDGAGASQSIVSEALAAPFGGAPELDAH
jgi:hypothetical protein